MPRIPELVLIPLLENLLLPSAPLTPSICIYGICLGLTYPPRSPQLRSPLLLFKGRIVRLPPLFCRTKQTANMVTVTPSDPIIICLLGVTGTGKSTFIKQVTGLDVPIGDDMDSLTATVTVYKTRLHQKEVWLMDTPGFNDTNDLERSDTVVLNAVSTELLSQHQKGLLVSGVVYLHKITDDKMYGTNIRNLRMFQGLVGQPSLKNVMLVTTKWDTVIVEDGYKRETQLKQKYWTALTAYGAQIARVQKDNPQSYVTIVETLMKNMGVTLQIQNELGSGMPLEQSSAGKVVLEDVTKVTDDLKEEMKMLMDELRKTKERGQEDMKRLEEILKSQKGQLESQLQQAQRDRELLRQSFQELQRQLASRPLAPSPPPAIVLPANLDGATPLHWAARRGDTALVEHLLNTGAALEARWPRIDNSTDRSQGTALHWASIEGHVGAMETLLNRGASINATNTWRRTPLHVAARFGHYQAVKLLVERGANKEARRDTNETPLHFAVEEDRYDVVQYLISAGADINAWGDRGTPLQFARGKGRTRIAQLLSSWGAR